MYLYLKRFPKLRKKALQLEDLMVFENDSIWPFLFTQIAEVQFLLYKLFTN